MGNLVGVVMALNREAEPFLERISAIKSGRIFYGKYKDENFIATVSGLGKVMAASATQHLIDHSAGLSYIIHFGVTGGLDDRLSVGDLIIPYKVIEYDVKRSSDSKLKEHEITIDNQYADCFIRALNPKRGIILSGDRLVSDSKTRKLLRETYGALSVDWESYAVAKVCEINKVPCVVMRVVCDHADKSSLNSFENNAKRISADLAEKILFVLEYQRPQIN